ncbi:MAG: hypothetical protein JSU68_02360 [Phycisphaerales bacterium]|nr:MAG: hypothetical protein JSU68_02360 [Phycisphaerales bacterium]
MPMLHSLRTRLLILTGVFSLCSPFGFRLADAQTHPAQESVTASLSAQARAPSPITLLPADAMAVYAGRPVATTDHQPSTAAGFLALAGTARQMGLWPRGGRHYADMLSALPLLGRYPHAGALLDVTVSPIGADSHRLNTLHAVVLVRCGEEVELIERRIAYAIRAYTNDQVSHVEQVDWRPDSSLGGPDTPITYHRLLDSRLPEWAACEWGPIDDLYIVGFGTGTWEHAARAATGQAPSLGADPWFRQAYADCRGPDAQIAVLLDPLRIRDRIGQTAPDPADRVIGALQMNRYQKSLHTFGRLERAITCYSASSIDGQYTFTPVSDPHAFRSEHLALIPPEAEHYAIMRWSLARWLPRVVRAYVASRSEQHRATINTWWDDLQTELSINVQQDLLDQLGETTVLHTYPPHPLGVPFLCTFLFEIKGDPARVERTLARLLTPVSTPDTQSASQPAAPSDRKPCILQARRADGIWYWQAGIFAVLGLGVDDNWLVLSFSPEAVRQNLAYLRAARTAPVTQGAFRPDRGARVEPEPYGDED